MAHSRKGRNAGALHATHGKNIDTSEDFALLGLSFGGIIVQEMNRFLSPKKTILISTVKNHSELPKLMRWGGKLNADRLIPMRFFTSDSFLSYSFLESYTTDGCLKSRNFSRTEILII